MKGNHIVCIMLIAAGIFFLSVNVHAVPNPGAIAWRASDGNYVNSLYRGVLGRNPTTPADQQTIQSFTQLLANKKISRVAVFWRFINSREYQSSRWAQQKQEYLIYWKALEAKWPNGNPYLCHCYYFSKDGGDGGYMTSMQYSDVSEPAGYLTFGVAAALTRAHAASDREACPREDCGGGSAGDNAGSSGSASGGQSYEYCRDNYCPDCKSAVTLLGQSVSASCQACLQNKKALIDQCVRGNGGTVNGGENSWNNVVNDPGFSRFGHPGGPWERWWTSRNAKATARPVSLSVDGQQTSALHIRNASSRRPHVYGTTSQRIAAQAGRTYQISLLAQARGLRSSSGVNISVDSQWRIRPINLRQGTYSWTKFSGTFTPQDNFIDLRIISEDVGEVWITALEIRPLIIK